jgi:PAS domain S-box-containing protein
LSTRSGAFKIGLVLATSSVLLALAVLNLSRKSRFELLDDGVFWDESQGRVHARRLDPEGPAARAGLAPGDVLVLIGDQPVNVPSDVRRILDGSKDGAVLEYQVLREKHQQALSLAVAPLPEGNVPVYYFLAAVGIFSLLVGTFVYVRRRGEAATAHFYNLCLFWFLNFGFSHTGDLDPWDWTFYWMDRAGILFFPPIFLHFALSFPTKPPMIRRRPWLLWALYLPSAALLYLSLTSHLAFLSPVGWGDRFFTVTESLLDRLMPAYLAVMSLLAFVAFVKSHRRARSITVKKQTKWIVWGTGFGTLPFVLFYAIPYLLGFTPGLTMELSVVPLALIPLAFAYAIVKYRLMDVEILFKRGMVYTLATSAVGGLYLAIFLAGAHYMVGDRHSTILALLSAIVVVMVFTPIKSRIQVGIDRLFYRERYDYRRALLAFSRDLNAHLDLDHLSSRLVERISDTFEVEKVALLVPGNGGELVVQAGQGLDENEWKKARLPAGSSLYQRLARGEAVYYADSDESSRGDVRSGARPPASSASSASSERSDRSEKDDGLGIAGLSYAIPCRSADKVVGVILLGRRWDQSALSSEDMDLLTMLSGQAATALENARLYRSLEQKAAEYAALKEHSENTIESLDAGILVLDFEGKVVRFNRALERLYGLARDRALGRAFDELFPKALSDTMESTMGKAWWTRAETSGISRLNLSNLAGEEKVVKLQVAPFVGSGEEQKGTLVIFEDVTSRVELETQLKLREKMASLGLLAAGVAHEVNTPLTGISSFTQMLQAQTSEDDPRAKLLAKIERQTERASKIVNNLLNFARQGRVSFVPVRVNDVVRDVLSLLEHQLSRTRVKVRLELGDDVPEVMGDENKLQQVFLNLILNAQDAMASGGWLTIKTSASPPASEDSQEVVAIVSDTGQGISQDDIKRIYDPFFTTKRAGASGTGLGLSITYGIIQEHSGHIGVESSLGQGTSFQIRLPANRAFRSAGAVDDRVRAQPAR